MIDFGAISFKAGRPVLEKAVFLLQEFVLLLELLVLGLQQGEAGQHGVHAHTGIGTGDRNSYTV